MKSILFASLLLFSAQLHARKNLEDLQAATETAKAADEQLRSNPNLTPEQRAEQEKVKAGAVGRIEDVAKAEPADAETQIDVSKSLASVSEAPRAIPYAERGLALAEKSNDPKLLRDALLAGADVYYRAGRYDLSRERAERLLKQNPQDKEARILFMQVNNRAPAGGRSASGYGDARGGAAAAASSPSAAAPAATAAAPAQPAPAAPSATITNAASLELKRQLELGRGVMRLDPKASLKHFDAALAASPEDVDALTARARARLEAGDAAGARADADAATRLAPSRADGWGLRAAAGKSLGRPEAELLADLEKAMAIDPMEYRDAYRELVARASGASSDAPRAAADAPRNGAPLPLDPGFFARIGLFAGGLGCVVAYLLFRPRRSDEDGSPRG